MQLPDGPATVKGSQCQEPLRQRGKGHDGDEPKSGDLPKILTHFEEEWFRRDDGKSTLVLVWIFLCLEEGDDESRTT